MTLGTSTGSVLSVSLTGGKALVGSYTIASYDSSTTPNLLTSTVTNLVIRNIISSVDVTSFEANSAMAINITFGNAPDSSNSLLTISKVTLVDSNGNETTITKGSVTGSVLAVFLLRALAQVLTQLKLMMELVIPSLTPLQSLSWLMQFPTLLNHTK